MRKFAYAILLLCVLSGCSRKSGEKIFLRFVSSDGTESVVERTLTMKDGCLRLKIDSLELAGIDTLEVLPSFCKAETGDSGWFVTGDGFLTKLRPRSEDKEVELTFHYMPIMGSSVNGEGWMSVVEGLPFETHQVVKLHDGEYDLISRVLLKDVIPYEPLEIVWYPLLEGKKDYVAMARKYREYQLARGRITPLKEKVKTRPELAYAAEAPEVRIRLAWKPMPTPVVDQTLENEPEMTVAVTFDRVKDIVDELKRQGVEKAEICLVGWNVKGHDGRFPTHFPVEEELGGETKLRELIRYAQDAGYQITAHSNRTDSYSVSPDWDPGDVCKLPDGSLWKNAILGGGQMYNVCYKQMYDKFFQEDERRIADLGFRGLEYIDVLSIVPPRPCWDPNHPLNRKQAAEYVVKMLSEESKIFGGVSSEGGMDYTCSVLDYVLYAAYADGLKRVREDRLADEYVPIWNIVYDGYVLNNPLPETVNYSIKEPSVALKVPEYGGRPSFYINSAYRNAGANWMGENDLRCSTDEELRAAVAEIKKGWDLLQKIGYLQFETLDNHEKLSEGVYRSTFSDGTRIVCDYNDNTWKVE